jgi:transcriptional regulator with XRE-family HTH domain|tara:strand:+ start:5439 stop:5798 length:360 start_codon:yes stop_codon:yes gene_type:complete
MNDMNIEFAEQFRKLRFSRHLTARELSKAADVGTTAITKIETQGHVPRPRTLRKLEGALNLSSHEKMLLWTAAGIVNSTIHESTLTPLEESLISMCRELGPDYAKEIHGMVSAVLQLRS